MKSILKIGYMSIIVALGMIILFHVKSGQSFMEVMNNIVISEYDNGQFSEEYIQKYSKREISIDKNTESFIISAKYLDINVSENAENILLEYYDLPNVVEEVEEVKGLGYSASFTESKYEIVFNKNIENYKRVKVTFPKGMEFDKFWAGAKELNMNGINANDITILSTNSEKKGYVKVSNLNAKSCRIMPRRESIEVNDSIIDDLLIISLNSAKVNINNTKGNNLRIGSLDSDSKKSMIYSLQNERLFEQHINYDVSLNKAEFKSQEYCAGELKIRIDNSNLNDYYFDLTSIKGTNKINNKIYESNYINGNNEDNKYKIDTVSKNLDLQIN